MSGTDVARRRDLPDRDQLSVQSTERLTINQMMELAHALETAALLPKDLRGKRADVLLVMMYGAELGLTPTQAIRSIDVVKGKPRMSGQLWIAKVREAGHKLEIDSQPSECTVTITRADDGQSHTARWDVQRAVDAGLCKRVEGKVRARSQEGAALPWETYTWRMLMWRAVTDCATVICPEIALGFSPSTPDDQEVSDQPVLATVVEARRKVVPEPEGGSDPTEDADAIKAAYAEIEAEHAPDEPEPEPVPTVTLAHAVLTEEEDRVAAEQGEMTEQEWARQVQEGDNDE